VRCGQFLRAQINWPHNILPSCFRNYLGQRHDQNVFNWPATGAVYAANTRKVKSKQSSVFACLRHFTPHLWQQHAQLETEPADYVPADAATPRAMVSRHSCAQRQRALVENRNAH
jgi:hypothetical protein